MALNTHEIVATHINQMFDRSCVVRGLEYKVVLTITSKTHDPNPNLKKGMHKMEWRKIPDSTFFSGPVALSD